MVRRDAINLEAREEKAVVNIPIRLICSSLVRALDGLETIQRSIGVDESTYWSGSDVGSTQGPVATTERIQYDVL